MTDSAAPPPDPRPPAPGSVPDGVHEPLAPGAPAEDVPDRKRRLVASAVVVAALVAAALTLTQLIPNNAQPAPGAPPTAASSTPAPATQSPVEMLSVVARNAGQQAPLALGPTQFVRQSITETESGKVGFTREDYVAADGWAWSHITEKDRITWSLFNAADTGDLMITEYPTDPEALEAHFRKDADDASSDEAVWTGLYHLLTHPLLSPKQREAAILVLQRVAQYPQASASDPSAGQSASGTATPTIKITAESLPGGGAGYRATLTDETPGYESLWMLLDSNGHVLRMGGGDDPKELSWSYGEVVDQLPAEYVSKLGTKRVEKDVDE